MYMFISSDNRIFCLLSNYHTKNMKEHKMLTDWISVQSSRCYNFKIKEHVLIDWTEDQLSINTQSDETDIMTLHCQLDID